MKNNLISFILLLVSCMSMNGQIGINNTNPKASLDVNGDMALWMENLELYEINTKKLDLKYHSFYNLQTNVIGPELFIEGIDYPENGKIVTLVNGSTKKITFLHKGANVAPKFQIYLSNSVSISILPNEIIMLAYDGVFGYWRLMANDLKLNSGWSLHGNETSGSQTIGTNNIADLNIITNYVSALKLKVDGDIEIGNPYQNFGSTKLLIKGGMQINDKELLLDKGGFQPTTLVAKDNSIQANNNTSTGYEATNLFLNNDGGNVGINMPAGTILKANLDVLGNGKVSSTIAVDKNLAANYGDVTINKNINVKSGTINTPFTGNANMLPIAYGIIRNGHKGRGSDNFTVTPNWDKKEFKIDVPGYEIEMLLLSSTIVHELAGGPVYNSDFTLPNRLRFYYTSSEDTIKWYTIKQGILLDPIDGSDIFLDTLAFVAFGKKI
jgi:hypothetical protein